MSSPDARTAPPPSTQPPAQLFRTLITANHILHYHNVVDAYGHISVRNPQNPQTFFLSRDRAPALVSQRDDLEEYHVHDASPVDPAAPKGYAERFIHSSIYKKYKDVHSVIHAHAEPVLPFSISSVPLRPVFHMGGVMGAHVPVYEISAHYQSTDTHSLLVTNAHLGDALASTLHTPSSSSSTNPSSVGTTTTVAKATSLLSTLAAPLTSTPPFPAHQTVLMRGHGFTCVGASVEEAVYRAVFTCANARVQSAALALQGGHGAAPGAEPREIRGLDERECRDAWAAIRQTAGRAWGLWEAEVRGASLYRNEMREGEGG